MSLLQPTRAMRDAAHADTIGRWDGLVAGYIGGPRAFHVWDPADWAMFPGPKLPIWVSGDDGPGEGWQCLEALYKAGVPRGCPVAADMETRRDVSYLLNWGGILRWAGFLPWVYGSASTVFGNPKLNGYWVADFTGEPHMHPHPGVRATQWTDGTDYDQSLVKAWITGKFWR